jgi:hypothetical protein
MRVNLPLTKKGLNNNCLGKTWSEEYKATFSAMLRSTTFWFLILDRKIRSNLQPSITIITIAAFVTL